MKIFIAGATGVLGRRVVAQLVADGHTVVGLSRSAANTDWLTQHGAEARPGDLFNAAPLTELSAGCEAVPHLATAIPTRVRSRRGDWALNDRLCTDGTRALVAAALANHRRVYVQQSITFIYGEHGDDWVDESTPVSAEPGGSLHSALEMEQIVAQAAAERGLPALVLRFGTFYCHDSAQTRALLGAAQRGQLPLIGRVRPFWSLIQVAAASAVVAAGARPAPAAGRICNVVDDEPARSAAVAAFITRTLGARPPVRLPAALARLLMGSDTVTALTSSLRVRNQRARDELGWQPRYASYRAGYLAEIEKWRAT